MIINVRDAVGTRGGVLDINYHTDKIQSGRIRIICEIKSCRKGQKAVN